MKFRGYIDESYSDRLFTLSCLMSTASGWLAFESRWRKCLEAKNKELKSKGRTPLSRYHASYCSSCYGEFRGWTNDEQISFTKDLLAVFRRQKHFLNVTAYTVPLDGFARVFPECSEDLIGYCYVHLLKLVLLEIAEQ